MPDSTHSLSSYLRVMIAAWRDDPREDAELLARFVETQDEAAFTALVGRHGVLVWRVCQRLLGDTPDAEDAFQGAFLALARQAGRSTVKNLAGWLHRVARRIALDIQTGARRRQGLEQQLRTVKQPEAGGGSTSRVELYTALDEELASLPKRLQVPLVLRYLESKTQDEVARVLGCSRSVALRRLARGEAILRERLERRGLGMGVVSVGALLGDTVPASAVPVRLLSSTARSAVAFRSGVLTGGAAEAAQTVLGALPSSLGTVAMRKSLWIVLACSVGLAGASLVVGRFLSSRADEPSGAVAAVGESASQPLSSGRSASRVDCYGDPLPEGALARLGTVRLRHPGPVLSVAFASDGKTVASGGYCHTDAVRLWEVATGKEIHTLKGHKGGVLSVAFASDGKTVASGGYDSTVRLWEVTTGKEIRTLKGHRGYVGSVAFSPDGKTVASGDDDTMCLWEVVTGKKIRILRRHQGVVSTVAFSPDGKTVASGGGDGMVCLWEVTTGREIRILRGHHGGVSTVAFASDGKTVASGGMDRTVRLWEATTGKEIRALRGHKEEVRSVAFSSDSKTVASGGRDGTVRLWEMTTGKEIYTLRGHQWVVWSVAFSSDGKTLASGGCDSTVRLWKIATGKEIYTQQGHQMGVSAVALSPDGKTVASGGRDCTVRLWKAATGREIRTLRGHQGWISALAFSSDGKTVASGGEDNIVHLWEVATGKEIHVQQGPQVVERGLQMGVSALAFSSDGKTVASLIDDGTVCLWKMATGKEICTLRVYEVRISVVAFAPDGKTVASGEEGGAVRMWEVATGKVIRTLEERKGGVRSVAFTPDGKTVASVGEDNTVRLWEAATGKEIRTLKGHKGYVWSVAFAPDGKTVASGGDFTVRLWEVATGKEIRTLQGHKGWVSAVAFAFDGRTLASVSADTTGLVWELTDSAVRPTTKLSPVALRALWTDLASQDAARARRAVWTLAATPSQSVPLLRSRLYLAPDPKRLARLIADLDADEFQVRQKAYEEVEKMGADAQPALRKGLKGSPSLELRKRLEQLLEAAGATPYSGEVLRGLRAVEVLEHSGTPEAREVLKTLAAGAPGFHLTQEAQAALHRLARAKRP